MAKLTDNTLVVHPDTGQAVSLRQGDEVPEWADGLVGSHLTERSSSGRSKSEK